MHEVVAENPVSKIKGPDDLASGVDATGLGFERGAGARAERRRNIEGGERAARQQEAVGQGRRIEKGPYGLACVVDPRGRGVGRARRVDRGERKGYLTRAQPRRGQDRAGRMVSAACQNQRRKRRQPHEPSTCRFHRAPACVCHLPHSSTAVYLDGTEPV